MGDYFSYILVAGAALLLAGPQILDFAKVLVPVRLLKPSIAPRKVSLHQSLLALAEVRQRLIDAGGVPDDADSAIEVLTHALLAGSDKP
jgi:hypothetical protein